MSFNPKPRPPLPVATPVLCQAKDTRRMWTGRMCWNDASRSCTVCGKLVCFTHSVFKNDDRITCVRCGV